MTPEAAKFILDTAGAVGPVRLIGVRGYNLLMDGGANQTGIYDDLIVRLIGDELVEFPASTDPGQKWIDHPTNPKGCAQLQCRPSKPWIFRLGIHQPSRGARPALVQAGEFIVNRLDSKGRVSSVDRGDDFGINLHSGGSEYSVGGFSAGCQVIQCPEGAWGDTWRRFFDPIAAMPGLRGVDIPYVLVDRLPALPATA